MTHQPGAGADDGLAELRADYPSWRFGTLRHHLADSEGRDFWARRLGVLLVAPDVPGLRAKLDHEQAPGPGTRRP